MDPLTMGLAAFKSFCEMVTEIEKGKPQEIKAKDWERWERFFEFFEQMFKINSPKPGQ